MRRGLEKSQPATEHGGGKTEGSWQARCGAVNQDRLPLSSSAVICQLHYRRGGGQVSVLG